VGGGYSPKRQHGGLYAGLFFVVLLLQLALALALVVLVLMSAEALVAAQPWLVAPVAVTGGVLLLLLVNFALLGAQALRTSRRERFLRRQEPWRERWPEVMSREGRLPAPPLPPEGVSAFLDFKESLDEEGQRMLGELARYYGLDATIVARLGSRRLSVRLETLEALAKLRAPEALPSLLALIDDPELLIRLRAARGAARTVAALPAGKDRDEAALALLNRLQEARLPLSAVGETLLLLGGAAERALARLLRSHVANDLVRVALEVSGRLRLSALAPKVASFVAAPNPELRAAALKSLSQLGVLPEGSRDAVEAACADAVEAVRIEAMRAAALLPPQRAQALLWRGLGDRAWAVRLGAAQMLLRLSKGEEVLRRALDEHPDRYARAVALQALLDAGAPVPEEWREALREHA
jgi:HEAT repeat protein